MVDFAVPADHRVKLKLFVLARELKKLWNIKVTMVSIVIGALWRTWKLEDEWRSSKLQHCWDQPEYREET